MMTTTANSSPGMARKFPGSLLALVLALFAPTLAAEPAEVFAPFGELLASSVTDGDVDYPAFANSQAFASMMAALATTAPAASASDDEKLAFYINAYNATSIQGILDGYSPSTLWGRLRFFKRREYALLNTSMTLFELEHDFIIAAGDPRIHFAIVCSSKSCPPLQSWLFDGASLGAQLDEVRSAFINNPASNRFDLERRKADLSRIFDWYEDEFEAAGGSLQGYLAQYVTDDRLRESLENDDWDLDFQDYDWSLNGTELP